MKSCFYPRFIYLTIIIVIFAMLDGCATGEMFRFPAEFEQHEAVWISWPTYENKAGFSTIPIHVQIIEALNSHVDVKIAVQDSAEIQTVTKILSSKNIPADHVSYHIVPHGDIWIRDMGPNFVVSNKNRMKVVDFNFNLWGYAESCAPESREEEQVDRLIADQMGQEIVMSRLISEGGNREFNGRGTMITVEAVERQRNPEYTIEQMTEEFKRVLGVEKVIWLKEGVYEDDLTFRGLLPGPPGSDGAYTAVTTGGHIDEFCRFVDPNTILLAEVSAAEAERDPIARKNKERLDVNYNILKKAVDQDGHPFDIIRMPMAETIYHTLQPGDEIYEWIATLTYEDGSQFPYGEIVPVIPAMSYLNFLITNGVVLAQSYWQPDLPEIIKDKDERAREILQSVFPNREIIMINPIPINLGGGGIHCITQQEPALN